MSHDLIQIIAAFAGSLGFALIFHVRGWPVLWSSVGGLMAWAVYLAAGHLIDNYIFQMFIAAFALGIYAEVMARVEKVPATVYLAVGFIPLIPGAALYTMMRETFEHDLQGILAQAEIAMYTALAISAGILITTGPIHILSASAKRGRAEQDSDKK